MHDELPGDDVRLAAALDAMQRTPAVPRDAVALIAARAVIANAPAARATRWTLRAAAAVAVITLGTLFIRQPRSAVSAIATTRVAPLGMPVAAAAAVPVLASHLRAIVFELDADDAHTVQVLGDFNEWSRAAGRMQRSSDGRWRLTTMLPPGRYVYAYLIDGVRFVRDPDRDAVEDRDFGVTGSEVVVSEAP